MNITFRISNISSKFLSKHANRNYQHDMNTHVDPRFSKYIKSTDGKVVKVKNKPLVKFKPYSKKTRDKYLTQAVHDIISDNPKDWNTFVTGHNSLKSVKHNPQRAIKSPSSYVHGKLFSSVKMKDKKTGKYITTTGADKYSPAIIFGFGDSKTNNHNIKLVWEHMNKQAKHKFGGHGLKVSWNSAAANYLKTVQGAMFDTAVGDNSKFHQKFRNIWTTEAIGNPDENMTEINPNRTLFTDKKHGVFGKHLADMPHFHAKCLGFSMRKTRSGKVRTSFSFARALCKAYGIKYHPKKMTRIPYYKGGKLVGHRKVNASYHEALTKFHADTGKLMTRTVFTRLYQKYHLEAFNPKLAKNQYTPTGSKDINQSNAEYKQKHHLANLKHLKLANQLIGKRSARKEVAKRKAKLHKEHRRYQKRLYIRNKRSAERTKARLYKSSQKSLASLNNSITSRYNLNSMKMSDSFSSASDNLSSESDSWSASVSSTRDSLNDSFKAEYSNLNSSEKSLSTQSNIVNSLEAKEDSRVEQSVTEAIQPELKSYQNKFSSEVSSAVSISVSSWQNTRAQSLAHSEELFATSVSVSASQSVSASVSNSVSTLSSSISIWNKNASSSKTLANSEAINASSYHTKALHFSSKASLASSAYSDNYNHLWELTATYTKAPSGVNMSDLKSGRTHLADKHGNNIPSYEAPKKLFSNFFNRMSKKVSNAQIRVQEANDEIKNTVKSWIIPNEDKTIKYDNGNKSYQLNTDDLTFKQSFILGVAGVVHNPSMIKKLEDKSKLTDVINAQTSQHIRHDKELLDEQESAQKEAPSGFSQTNSDTNMSSKSSMDSSNSINKSESTSSSKSLTPEQKGSVINSLVVSARSSESASIEASVSDSVNALTPEQKGAYFDSIAAEVQRSRAKDSASNKATESSSSGSSNDHSSGYKPNPNETVYNPNKNNKLTPAQILKIKQQQGFGQQH